VLAPPTLLPRLCHKKKKQSSSAMGHNKKKEEGRNVFKREVVRLSIGPWQRLHLPYFFPTCATRRRRWRFKQE